MADRVSLPIYRWVWSADLAICTLWLDRGDRVEKLGYICEVPGDGWLTYSGEVSPVQVHEGGSYPLRYSSRTEAAVDLLWHFAAPATPLPPRVNLP